MAENRNYSTASSREGMQPALQPVLHDDAVDATTPRLIQGS